VINDLSRAVPQCGQDAPSILGCCYCWRASYPHEFWRHTCADFTGKNISQAIFGDRSHSEMVNQYFDTSLFTVNAVGTYGNAPRNMLAGPGLFNIDMAAIKYFPINERMKFQFRAEFFNLLNNVNFTVPGLGSASPDESAVGNIVGTGNFGKLTFAADPRILQFALKLLF
jgi:hypothetical protein